MGQVTFNSRIFVAFACFAILYVKHFTDRTLQISVLIRPHFCAFYRDAKIVEAHLDQSIYPCAI